MMRTYGCSGTLGDTYINLCILYHTARREPIVCRHYTTHTNWHKLIKQIYSLLPNIQVEFINQRDTVNPRIYSSFVPHAEFGVTLSSPDDWCLFPQFAFPHLSSCLPKSYVVLNPQSGREDQGRILTKEVIDKTIKDSQYPVVVLGTGQISERIKDDNVINLAGKTSLLEAMGIASKASHFYGFQGLMSFVAMSHRIESKVYANNEGYIHAILARMPKQWEQYCSIVRE